MTYLELFNKLKEINKDTYLDEIIYEFIYDEYVFDLLTFIEFRHKFKKDYKEVSWLFILIGYISIIPFLCC